MSKLLSITIPTYNRAAQLNAQLAWLAKEIRNFEDVCDILVYDNCSTDDTPNVVSNWQKVLGQTTLKLIRHSENIGGMKNLAHCLQESTSEFTWTVGDDDPINDGTLAFVIRTLKDHPNLALLYLNFSGYNQPEDHVFAEHYLPTDLKPYPINGKKAFQHCIEDSIGGVIFLTATIYRTEFARTAVRMWADSVKNWAGQAFWAGYCATQGDVMVTKDNYMVCIVGVSQWQSQNKIGSRIPSKDVPEVCFKLQEIGYPHVMSRRVILKNFKDYFNIQSKGDGWKGYTRPLRQWPLASASAFLFVLGSLGLSTLEGINLKESVDPAEQTSLTYSLPRRDR